MLTCPCNEETPYIPLLYSKTGVYKGIHFFLTFALKHRLWVLVRTASRVPTINILSKNKKKYYIFSSENNHFYSREIFQYIARTCLRNDRLLETGAIRTNVLLSKPKWETATIINTHKTKRTYG